MGRLTSLTDGLYFSENNFKYSLPTEIGMLESFVSNMVFKHNKLSSTLPSELAQLTSASGCILLYDNPRLEYYTIGKNLTNFQVPFIAGLSNTIPSEVGFQTGLSTFSCESLELEGSIPTEIGFGTLLTEVLLASNELESSLPSEIGTLRQLSTLDVHYNYFTGAPTDGPTLTPSAEPSKFPTLVPTPWPTLAPSLQPSQLPTLVPTPSPTLVPSLEPSKLPTFMLTPSKEPTPAPTIIREPDHEFDFRGCSDSSATADTGVDGSGITATATNGASCSSEGMVFDGSDDYVDVTPWEFGAPITVEAYVKWASYASSNSDRIIDFGNDDGQFSGYTANTNRLLIFNTNSRTDLRLQTFDTTTYTRAQCGFIELDEWVHIVGTVDGSNIVLYWNGTKCAEITRDSEAQLPTATRAYHTIGNSGGTRPFDGTIAYVRFWHGEALNASQVAEL